MRPGQTPSNATKLASFTIFGRALDIIYFPLLVKFVISCHHPRALSSMRNSLSNVVTQDFVIPAL